jgi:hypothetical protein
LGMGVYMEGGTLTDCLIYKNSGSSSATSKGSGVYMTGGIMMNCTINDNGNSVIVQGAGVYLTADGVVSNCIIRSNKLNGQNNDLIGGGGVWMSGGLLRNSVIMENYGGGSSYNNGGGVMISGGRMENCLVVSNYCYGTYGGGGVSISGGVIANCTIAENRVDATTREVNPRMVTPESGAGVRWRGGGNYHELNHLQQHAAFQPGAGERFGDNRIPKRVLFVLFTGS